MIKYALRCSADHAFEAWFGSSDGFDDQKARGLVTCPICGTPDVDKQIMAPAIRDSGAKQGKAPVPAGKESQPTPADLERVAGKIRAHIAETHDYVGDSFAEEARSMHYGEQETRPVWGETSPEDAKALAEEGIPAAPLPAPFAPPKPAPKDIKKLN